MASETLNDTVFAMGSHDRAYITGDHVTFAEGDAERVVQVMFDNNGESLTLTFDAYHLRQLRLALQRAERWVKG